MIETVKWIIEKCCLITTLAVVITGSGVIIFLIAGAFLQCILKWTKTYALFIQFAFKYKAFKKYLKDEHR